MFPHDPDHFSEAKRIILGILQVNGGSYTGKTRLYKVFYDAHLYYWKENGCYLSSHPIVHMPNGPGIDSGPAILHELASEGLIVRRQRPVGPYSEDVYQLTQAASADLTREEREAIQSALDWVGDKTASEISQESHERSRTWREAKERGQHGIQLHIYLDVLSEEDFDKTRDAVLNARQLFDSPNSPVS